MKNLFSLIIILSLGMLLNSCGDDNNPPSITINAPAPNSILGLDSILGLEAVITDDVEVRTLVLRSETTTALLEENFDLSTFTDRSNIDIAVDIDLSDLPSGDYLFVLTATDDQGESTSEDVNFSIQ